MDSDSIFNNLNFENIKKSLNKKELKKYEEIGKDLYESINYTDGKVITTNNDNNAKYILEGIKSGLHPSMLSTEEKNILSETFGDEWYKKYGYTENDLNNI